MQVKRYSEVEGQPVQEAPGVTIRWVVAREDGAPNFAMRVLEVAPGASTPHHVHSSEHEVFVLDGKGAVRSEAGERPLSPGTVVF
ncbi:MAG: cupin domain-containing protein, partial [Candidatus Eisenbacteria bacterium]|nr:cupin domain-containing protein [Candidatus Eisenbacteria bacterium]